VSVSASAGERVHLSALKPASPIGTSSVGSEELVVVVVDVVGNGGWQTVCIGNCNAA